MVLLLLHQTNAFVTTTSRLNSRSPTKCLNTKEGNNNSDQIFQEEDCFDLCDAFGNPINNNNSNSNVTPTKQIQQTTNNKNYKSSKRILRPLWSDPQPTKCTTCRGHGDLICRFCDETGYLATMGEQVFYAGVGQDCPVCNDGMEVCTECAGTGYVFSWDAKRSSRA